jgi:TPR repeat protein
VAPFSEKELPKWLKESCKNGDQFACVSLGLLFEKGMGIGTNFERARQLYDAACQADFAWGCNNLANLYRRGQGVLVSLTTAVDLYKKACDSGFVLSCMDMAAHYLNGEGVKQDHAKYLELTEFGCKRKFIYGNDPCLDIEILRALGFFVAPPQSNHHSRNTLLAACKKGHGKSCYDLGIMCGNGIYGSITLEEARKWVKQPCDLKYKVACELLPAMKTN